MQTGNTERGAVRTKLVVLFLITVLVVVGLILFVQYRERVAKSPKTAGNTFVHALIAGDTDSSYAMLTDRSKKELAKDAWQDWVKITFTNYGRPAPKASEEAAIQDPKKLYGENATPVRLRYDFTFHGQTRSTNIILVKNGDGWKVSEVGAFE